MDEPMSGRDYDDRMVKEAREAFAEHEISERGEGRWMLQTKYKDTGKWDWNLAAEVVSLTGKLYVGGDLYPVIFGYANEDAEGKVRWMGRHSDVSYYVHQKACIGLGAGDVEGVTDEFRPEVAKHELLALIDERAEEFEDDLPREIVEVLDILDMGIGFEQEEEGPDLSTWLESELPKEVWAKLKDRLEATLLGEADPLLEAFKAEFQKEALAELLKDDPIVEAIQSAIQYSLYDGAHELFRHLYDAEPEFMQERGSIGMVCAGRVYYAWGALARLTVLLDQEAKDDEQRGEAAAAV